ncbi:hypothetical protein SLEP1_g41056 [Rubroshorea leprosula]|uniref:Secreted protein n=1 Tax=Rubroshorea leprosula TaxID=152421 RepID=A0AAV5L5M1_9ROSI|nr:hypothetical protein SLEP1_g41056 [Rubroshorea leprosula]
MLFLLCHAHCPAPVEASGERQVHGVDLRVVQQRLRGSHRSWFRVGIRWPARIQLPSPRNGWRQQTAWRLSQ